MSIYYYINFISNEIFKVKFYMYSLIRLNRYIYLKITFLLEIN